MHQQSEHEEAKSQRCQSLWSSVQLSSLNEQASRKERKKESTIWTDTIATHAFPLASASPLTTLGAVRGDSQSFEANTRRLQFSSSPSLSASSQPCQTRGLMEMILKITGRRISSEAARSHAECCISNSFGMTEIDTTINTSTAFPCPDCSAFMNWSDEQLESVQEKTIVFPSLVATVKSQPALDDSLEAKAVNVLESMSWDDEESADAFLSTFASESGNSSTVFVQCIVVLISSASKTITTTAMEMCDNLITNCSARVLYALVQADLIPQLIVTLNPRSHSFTETVDIHFHLFKIIWLSLWLATPDCLEDLEIEDENGQQVVRETVLKQVLVPSEKYIWHLCMNRYSIVDGDQSKYFLEILAQLLEIYPYHQPTTEIILHMPVFLAIPSCLTFFENDYSIYSFLYDMSNAQREWNITSREVHQKWKKTHRMLRMEGIEDVIEEKLQNDQNTYKGLQIVVNSLQWNNLLSMNLPNLW
ncbi:hypothetical protein BLNAU_19120 [Blattamonas nauphoetae]|uniref:RING-type E3 ubiquitin transferase n=1 Tax=Blattamonas nauphoetae TaxID=2049346 RepID=A0ABQ9X2H4_9EUKA|nr:hypothetical protein BLNAU_19120 [Blattamonas nauphoetae]